MPAALLLMNGLSSNPRFESPAACRNRHKLRDNQHHRLLCRNVSKGPRTECVGCKCRESSGGEVILNWQYGHRPRPIQQVAPRPQIECGITVADGDINIRRGQRDRDQATFAFIAAPTGSGTVHNGRFIDGTDDNIGNVRSSSPSLVL